MDNKQVLDDFIKEVNSLAITVSRMLAGTEGDEDVTSDLPTLPASLTDSQAPIESNVAMKASMSNTADESMSDIEDQLRSDMKQKQLQIKTRDQISKLQNILLILADYKRKSKELVQLLSTNTGGNILRSFYWQAMLHYQWSSRNQTSFVSSLDSSIEYGYFYSGSAARIVLTPQLEKSLHHLLKTAKQGGNSLVTGIEVCDVGMSVEYTNELNSYMYVALNHAVYAAVLSFIYEHRV